jgi:hypothetical protein
MGAGVVDGKFSWCVAAGCSLDPTPTSHCGCSGCGGCGGGSG